MFYYNQVCQHQSIPTESFRFWDEKDYTHKDIYVCMCTRFSRYLKVVLTREPASFWRENEIAVVNLLRVLARMS